MGAYSKYPRSVSQNLLAPTPDDGFEEIIRPQLNFFYRSLNRWQSLSKPKRVVDEEDGRITWYQNLYDNKRGGQIATVNVRYYEAGERWDLDDPIILPLREQGIYHLYQVYFNYPGAEGIQWPHNSRRMDFERSNKNRNKYSEMIQNLKEFDYIIGYGKQRVFVPVNLIVDDVIKGISKVQWMLEAFYQNHDLRPLCDIDEETSYARPYEVWNNDELITKVSILYPDKMPFDKQVLNVQRFRVYFQTPAVDSLEGLIRDQAPEKLPPNARFDHMKISASSFIEARFFSEFLKHIMK